LGRACAIALAEAGATIIAVSRTKSDLDRLEKSDLVLLTAIIVAPASAKAIAHALPKPFPAPVTRDYLFFKLIFFRYILLKYY
jgi:NAD(P)-dependent dehydrogenase (short-subunit alcohol dehydrogenase family)